MAHLSLDLTPPTPREHLDVTSRDGVRLSVELHGATDGPLVVLCHGWTCSTRFWAPVIRRLAVEHHVVAYDQRGHGRSEQPARSTIHPDTLADDLAAVLEATVTGRRRAVLVGHSLGAMSIVAFAGRHHDHLRRSVAATLLASTGVDELAGRLDLVPLPGRAAGRVPEGLARLVQFFVRGGLADSLLLHSLPRAVAQQVVRHLTLSASATDEQTAFTTDVILSCSRLTHHWFARLLQRLDLSPDVLRLDVPTQVLVGEVDRLTPPWHAYRLAERLPAGTGVIELPGVGHMTPIQASDAVAIAVRSLVEEHLTGVARVPRPRPVPDGSTDRPAGRAGASEVEAGAEPVEGA